MIILNNQNTPITHPIPNQRTIIITTKQMEVHQPQTNELYCATCSQHYPNTDSYKQHYKSDFHRYNIKRKMVKLVPVTLEQFNAKMQETKALDAQHFSCN
jgi:hypothetical protein